ncbi:amidase family protein [Herbaspirillum sp. alder98]|uniref:amidase family protein n=1 Tax=Herbaspirillum sp. alder98 TaxID=2913096 RepID=UPI001CD81DBE|nr:amidase [Herbaspirillum sp. alder98]MCA1325824.1 amidase [Herbaspirillum sp. alder98]
MTPEPIRPEGTDRTVPGTGHALLSRFHLGGSGPTVAIKDCIDIAGMVTGGGSAALADAAPAAANADVVDHLIHAGWQITSRANMHELAYGMTGINEWNGTPINPQDPARMPGGSSSGSASAVGAGLVDLSIGSDTGGSIRLPAACCGVAGFKPTFGRVSRNGAWPRHSSIDCVGPFARSMDLIISAMATIAPGFDGAAAAVPQTQARVKLVHTNSDAAILAAVQAAFEASGWQGQALELDGMQSAFEAGMVLINRETWAAFGYLTGGGRLGADIEKRLTAAGTTSDDAVAAAERVRASFSAAVDAALTDADALLLPTLPQLPPTLAEIRGGTSVLTLSSLVRPFNLSGHPALTVPVPIAGSTLRAGLQLVGRRGDDERICALGLHLEQALKATSA